MMEERISELEDLTIETSKTEKEKRLKKPPDYSRIVEQPQRYEIPVMRITEEDREKKQKKYLKQW